jgi:hypothetical protein
MSSQSKDCPMWIGVSEADLGVFVNFRHAIIIITPNRVQRRNLGKILILRTYKSFYSPKVFPGAREIIADELVRDLGNSMNVQKWN